ncbi:ABC-type branched-subunit amino acid transport system substrate-binding protein [Saccharomonospora amisosensis]|uniref:ABC-type branched-subunit amino acid transport system substrate-binding protein n=1 Tax=Saccharomonospora amisosensis TaxID=1128677 RepID=A0A7X5UNX1_9PSEU|nr:ABC transporter substrate-binding protein [Saccharomonospora amisosensis]NIJ11496.1 ABC-type branched-subunit amino acid transport system substrate-binding protein [Saccharomonospora amisosensis]
MRRIRTLTAVVAAGCVAVLAACSTTDPNASGGGGNPDEVKTGNGVTDTEINIGVLTDLSGPFAAGAAVQVEEKRAYWAAKNEAGGICGRKVNLQVQDHGYDPQKAVSLYRSMSGDVVALQQVLGSPVVAAVLPLAQEDNLYVGGMGWASVALDKEVAQVPGSTYSIEAANAVDYLIDDLGVAKGSKIGHVYFVGDYGSDALAGARHAAKERGVEIVPIEITPKDTDLSAQAASLQQQGVSAVLLSAAPSQLASLSAVLDSRGVDVPIIGNTPTFNPALLDTPSRKALVDNVYSITSIAPYTAEGENVKKSVELYESKAPNGAKGWEVPLAYAQAELLSRALEGACESGDLTPEGVVAAMRETSDLDTGGLFPGKLDYTKVGEPPTREVFVSKVDPDVPAGLRVEKTLEGPSASSYQFE